LGGGQFRKDQERESKHQFPNTTELLITERKKIDRKAYAEERVKSELTLSENSRLLAGGNEGRNSKEEEKGETGDIGEMFDWHVQTFARPKKSGH